MPTAIVGPAMLTRAAAGALRMVIGILIERDGEQGMRVTEYVATSSTVVPSCKVCEISCASSFVADRRFRIRLEDEKKSAFTTQYVMRNVHIQQFPLIARLVEVCKAAV